MHQRAPLIRQYAGLDLVMNHATVRERMDMVDFIKASVARGLAGISIWGEEIDRIGVARARQLVTESGLPVLGYNRVGPLSGATFAERPALFDAARREIERAAEFGADHVLVFPGGLPLGEKDIDGQRRWLNETVARLLGHARSCGVKLALEPLHPMLCGDRSIMTSLTEANDLCDQLGDGIGIVIDVYHVWWDNRLAQEIARAGVSGRILGFHVNDWLVPTRDILRDRGMMGDGIIDLAHIWRLVRKAGYGGPIEVEIFSDHWAQQDPELVLDTAIERCRAIFSP